MHFKRNRVLTTLMVAALVPLGLAACGGNLKTTLLHRANKKIEATNKKLASMNKPSPLRYCRPTAVRQLLPKDAPSFVFHLNESSVDRVAGPNVDKVFGNKAVGPVLTLVSHTFYEKATKSPFYVDLHRLVKKGDLKAVPLTFKNKAGQTLPGDALVWVGAASDVQTSGWRQYAVDNGRFEIASFQRVSAICGGSLEATKVNSYTQPGKNSSGVTTTTADMSFQFEHVPAWLTSTKWAIFTPMKSVKASETSSGESIAQAYASVLPGGPNQKRKVAPKALNPKAVLSGKVAFQKENDGWHAMHMNIPVLQAAFAQEAMKLSGL